jgi:hypothetical protein
VCGTAPGGNATAVVYLGTYIGTKGLGWMAFRLLGTGVPQVGTLAHLAGRPRHFGRMALGQGPTLDAAIESQSAEEVWKGVKHRALSRHGLPCHGLGELC